MKRMLILMAVMLLLATSCRLLGGEEDTEEQIEEPPQRNEYALMLEDLKRTKNALRFEQNKDKYPSKVVEALAVPRKELIASIKCSLNCKSTLLSYIGGTPCGLSQQDIQTLQNRINNLVCVPASVHEPDVTVMKEIQAGVENFGEGSVLVMCYQDQGELLFHIKNKKIVQVYSPDKTET